MARQARRSGARLEPAKGRRGGRGLGAAARPGDSPFPGLPVQPGGLKFRPGDARRADSELGTRAGFGVTWSGAAPESSRRAQASAPVPAEQGEKSNFHGQDA